MKKILILTIATIILLTGCAKNSNNPYDGKETISPLGLEGVFVDTSVKEITDLIDNKETFVFVASFEDCPHCQEFLPYLYEAAKERNYAIGYIDTRKDSSWQSNLDIDDYNLFVEYFGEFLLRDEDNIPHLYVPHTFFVKEGTVIQSLLLVGDSENSLELLMECFDKLELNK